MSSLEQDTQTSTDIVYVLSSFDDGVIEVFDSMIAAEDKRLHYDEDGMYSWYDMFITTHKISKEIKNGA
jgi:hypothetical protein